MNSIDIAGGYSIRAMEAEEFFPLFQLTYDAIFGDHHTFFPNQYFHPDERDKQARLKARLGNLFKLQLGLFSEAGEFVGYSFGAQETAETFYMIASAVLPAHQNRGLYTALVKEVVRRCTEEGFQKIYGTHCATNNAVLVPKLKLGFVISKIEISEVLGTVIHTQFYTNALRRKVLDYRSGLTVPDQEVRSVMKFDRKMRPPT